MRCPKCHYVSFDGQNRCRNCGYELSLTQPSAPAPPAADRDALPRPDGSTPRDTPPRDAAPRETPLRDSAGPPSPGQHSPGPRGSGVASPGLHRDPPPRGQTDPFDLSTRPGNPTATPLADLSLRPERQTGPSGPVPDRFGPDRTDRVSADRRGPDRLGADRLGLDPAAGPDTFAPLSPAGTAGSGSGTARARAQSPQDTDPLDLPLFSPGSNPGAGLGPGPDLGGLPASGTGGFRDPRDRDDRPLISPSTPPRPPLAVRRTTGELPRARPRVTPGGVPPPQPRAETPRLELDLPSDQDDAPDDLVLGIDTPAGDRRDARGTGSGAGTPGAFTGSSILASDTDTDDATANGTVDSSAAPLGTRAIAALVDLGFLALVDATVLHFTLRLTGLTVDDITRLPFTPLLGFLALLNGGYLTMFTAASGQTMGKMATGVKVVSMDGGTVPFGHAVLRAILWLLTIVPLGVGAIPALLTDDRRALHDRLADTRVIKVE
jgi:uncharacterized RDD family membrane protein YckC